MSDSDEDLAKKWEGKIKKNQQKRKKGKIKKEPIREENKELIEKREEQEKKDNLKIEESKMEETPQDQNEVNVNSNNLQENESNNINERNDHQNIYENPENYNRNQEEDSERYNRMEIPQNDVQDNMMETPQYDEYENQNHDEPQEDDGKKELFDLLENEDYDSFFDKSIVISGLQSYAIHDYKQYLSIFYEFLIKIQIKTSSSINNRNLSSPRFIDIKTLQKENKDIPLKNLNQLIENNYVYFKEYIIDPSNPHCYLAIFFFMMCDNSISNYEKNKFIYILSDMFPWYKLDKIKDLNNDFIVNLNAIENYCSKNDNHKREAFEKVNFHPLSSDKFEDYNLAATIMRCYFLNILIDTSFNSVEKEETDLLSYEFKTAIDLIKEFINENALSLDIIQKFFVMNHFDYYNNFLEIKIKDKNLDLKKILNENEDNSNQYITNYYSMINNKLIVLIKPSDIDYPNNQFKPFDVIPFNLKLIEYSCSIFDNLNIFFNDYYQKYQDFTSNFPNIDNKLQLSFNQLYENVQKVQQFIDENFEVKGRPFKLDTPNLILNDNSIINEFFKNYRSKEEEINKLNEELYSYGIMEKSFQNYCKKCYDDKYKVITLSCNHEICEECIRNYISYKTFNLILVKYSPEGILNCIKCPFEDCSIFMTREEIFPPFSIHSNILYTNYFKVYIS